MRRLLFFVLLLVILAAGYLYMALYQPYQGFPSGGVYVDIPRGAPQRTIARLLAESGVVRSRMAFEALCRSRKRRNLEAGEYFFDHPLTSFEVFDALANGRVFVKELVVPEGFTMFDIADLAAHEGFLSREDFLAAARDPSLILDLAPHAPSLEGFLFPATYEFPRHVTGKELTGAMVKRFRQIWVALPPVDAAGAPSTVQGVVTLASLVERETPRPEERPHVAGVFANRLRIRQPLQCDPTVAYALALAGKYTGKLNSQDLRFASPYNTYHNRGLPPGPIANPGEASLQAAAAPSPTDDFYFVANAEGGHFFSKTLREHNRNVARYRRLRQQPQSEAFSSAPTATTVSKTSPTRPR
jgi:UPF0755 protein